MYDDVLFPTNSSVSASIAFEHALSIAERYDARAHALCVANTTYTDIGATGSTLIDSLREHGESVVAGIEEVARANGIKATTRITEGDPHCEILKYAGEHIDLILMGTRGCSGIDRYLLGVPLRKWSGRPISPSSPSIAARIAPTLVSLFGSITQFKLQKPNEWRFTVEACSPNR